MKRSPFMHHWLIVGFVFLLALSACERPIPRDDVPESPDAIPTTDPLIIPTAPPVIEDTNTGVGPVTEESGEAATEDGATTTDASETTDSTGETSSATPAETTPDQSVVEAGGEVVHVVQSGETMGYIADLYGVSIQDIATASGIVNVDSLAVGQELIVKAGAAADTSEETAPETSPETGEQVHVVRAGENLYRIGLQYGFTPEELAVYNNIIDVTRIDVGQIIKIPPK